MTYPFSSIHDNKPYIIYICGREIYWLTNSFCLWHDQLEITPWMIYLNLGVLRCFQPILRTPHSHPHHGSQGIRAHGTESAKRPESRSWGSASSPNYRQLIGFGNFTINSSTHIALQLRGIELFLAGGFQFSSDLLCQASTKDSEKSSWTYAITKHKSMERDA